MPTHDDLGNRMKMFYESVPKTRLVRRMPVAIRIDGKSFHTFTKGFNKPFDDVLMKSMQDTMKYLCENIQGCVFGYTQSDEITLILIDYKKLTSSAWFDYEVQKMCSVAASMATMAFNKAFADNASMFNKQHYFAQLRGAIRMRSSNYTEDDESIALNKLIRAYGKAANNGAMFDARCFNVPKEEVANLVYWRQLDATRNSIQMVGQANFSHNELQNKSCNAILDMLNEKKDINWDDFPVACKRGTACIKRAIPIASEEGSIRTEWYVDENMPILKDDGRRYVNDLIYVGE